MKNSKPQKGLYKYSLNEEYNKHHNNSGYHMKSLYVKYNIKMVIYKNLT